MGGGVTLRCTVHQNRDRGGRILAEGAGAAVLQAFGQRRGVFMTAALPHKMIFFRGF